MCQKYVACGLCVRARVEIDYACVLRNTLRAVTNSYESCARAPDACGSQPVINTGHYQPFKHPHIPHSPPIGVEKLSGVFMNNILREAFSYSCL